MEKLIELLNEYEENRIEKINSEWKLMVKLSFRPYTEESLTNKAYRSCWEEICSKYYGFIKRLVENDKIDLEELTAQAQEKIRLNLFGYKDNKELDTDLLLMLLSISDNPISDLCSYLR